MKRVIFSKYSNERARKFAIRTDILEDEAQNRTVRKSACYPEGKQHIRNLARWYQKLSEAYAGTSISMNRCVLTEEGMEPEFVHGRTLEEELDERLLANDVQGCIERLMEYIGELKKAGSAQRFSLTKEFEEVFGAAVLSGDLLSAATTDIDMLVANVITTDEGWVHMDYEWTFEFPIPVNFVIYRTLMYYMEKGALRAPLLSQDLYRYAGLTKQEIAQYVQMEACFQQYLLGESVPLRLLYRHISPGYVDFQKEEKARTQALAAGNARILAEPEKKPPVEICVDTLEEASGLTYIQGWAVSRSLRPLTFAVKDHLGRQWKTEEVRLLRRQDVNDSFAVTDPDYCAGFRICVRMPEDVKEEKVKFYVLSAGDGISEGTLVLHTDRLRFKNSRVGRKLMSLKGDKPRHEIRYITPYKMGLFGETHTFHSGEQRYDSFRRMTGLTPEEEKRQRGITFSAEALVSMVSAVDGAAPGYLRQMLDSVRRQTCRNWELWLAGSKETREALGLPDSGDEQDGRIHYVCTEKGCGYAGCINAAVEKAAGGYILEIGAQDTLSADTVFELMRCLEGQKEADILYTDEDSVDATGEIYTEPLLKPDYNFYMLRSTNYIGHGMAIKKSLVQAAGGMRAEFDGASGYDFALRCCERAKKVCHIPHILYHCRRMAEQKSSADICAAWDMGKQALAAHYNRTGAEAEVQWAQESGTYRTKWKIKGQPKVAVIIPNMDHAQDLEKCVRSIADKTTYGNYEIVIVENNSREKRTFSCYEKLKKSDPRVRVITWEDTFNYAAINNFAVEKTDAEYLLFLNNDTEVISRGWMEEMLGICQQPGVGIVGAKLYYPDGTIQHAGVIIGLSGIAGHLFLGEPGTENGYMARAAVMQNLSAVTAACMMVKRTAFEAVGGFDETLKVALNDVDFCLKAGKDGQMVVFTPHAELYHYESKSRGLEDTPEKKARYEAEAAYFREKWQDILENGDPFYHPNLSLTSWTCALSVSKV